MRPESYRCSACGLEVEGGNLDGLKRFLCNRWYHVWLFAGRFYPVKAYLRLKRYR